MCFHKWILRKRKLSKIHVSMYLWILWYCSRQPHSYFLLPINESNVYVNWIELFVKTLPKIRVFGIFPFFGERERERERERETLILPYQIRSCTKLLIPIGVIENILQNVTFYAYLFLKSKYLINLTHICTLFQCISKASKTHHMLTNIHSIQILDPVCVF
jgi:hypothetical protein